MKTFLKISMMLLIALQTSCQKKKCGQTSPNQSNEPVIEKFGPYGKESKWLSIGGDTLFSDTLLLTYFYTEITIPCNICYYQQTISFWNDYDYTFSVAECTTPKDTLIFTDIDSGRKAIFKRKK